LGTTRFKSGIAIAEAEPRTNKKTAHLKLFYKKEGKKFYTSIRNGSSSRLFKVSRNAEPVAPSTTR
jgi:hypothetical protein